MAVDGGAARPGARFAARPPGPSRRPAGRLEALPAHSGSTDRLRVAVTAAAATDPLRFDLSPEAGC